MRSTIHIMKLGTYIATITTVMIGVIVLFIMVYDSNKRLLSLEDILRYEKGEYLIIIIMMATGLIASLLAYGSVVMLEVVSSIREKTRNSAKVLCEMHQQFSVHQEKL